MKGSVFDFIGERMLGANAGNILAIVAIVSLAAGLNAWTFAGPRIYYAMARDGVFFPAAAQVHPKFKTPHTSIIAQALWTSVLILTGSLDTLANYVGFAIILFAGIAVAAVFVLRARSRTRRVPTKRSAIPLHPRLRADQPRDRAECAVPRPRQFGLGLLVIASGIPLYVWLTRRRR